MAPKPERESTRDSDDDEEVEEDDGKCAISPNTMKLVTLIALLVSDFDIVFTWVSMYVYFVTGGLYVFFAAVVGFFQLCYVGACAYAAMEAKKFVQRFQDKVKLKCVHTDSNFAPLVPLASVLPWLSRPLKGVRSNPTVAARSTASRSRT